MRKYTKPTSIPPNKQNKIYPITKPNPNNIHYPNTKVHIIILKITVTI
jgi:hypothetical protein